MEISKSKFDEIYAKYKFWIDDPTIAFDFVHDVLAAEADFIKSKNPEWWNTVDKLNNAAYRVFNVGSDISNESFDGQY